VQGKNGKTGESYFNPVETVLAQFTYARKLPRVSMEELGAAFDSSEVVAELL